MDILFLLIPLSLVLVFLVGLAFWWSVRSGQFDDLEGEANRILMDDDLPPTRAPDAKPEVSESPEEQSPKKSD